MQRNDKKYGEMSMGYTIRTIEKSDDLAVEAVIRSCLVEFGANHPGTAWTDPYLNRFSEVYNSEGNRYWVAADETGKIVGGVGVGTLTGGDDPQICELQKMYCLPEARGTGVAQQLMDVALAYAKRYYKAVYLETLDNMVAAQRFYEKFEFSRINYRIGDTGHSGCGVCYLKEL